MSPIIIDGLLNEADWLRAETVSNFTQITPDAGASATLDTKVKVIYDDDAIYVGAFCPGSPDQISKVLSQRDSYNSNTDYFSVLIDTYSDQLNGFVFSLSTMGVQYDAKIYAGTYNSKLDMIWYGEVTHSKEGYTVEIKIPFSALRFSPKEEQEWRINFTRLHSLNREESSWNPIQPDLDNVVTQAGILKGLKDITPPLRLFLSPYVSAYADHFPSQSEELNDWTANFNGGMDIKYGINEAYTLDMTLIPDFGQVVTDNVVLNLTPFEVFFQENRPFFNEGIELYEKTDHFYSRRVGYNPINRSAAFADIKDNEIVVSNPDTKQLINASKFSGRGDNGLGIGIFNGISAAQYAQIEDTVEKTFRNFETDPLSNYNVFVADQNLKNNSSITLTNTNVWRSGHIYDANLTALASELNTKDNRYFMSGNGAISQKYSAAGNQFGHSITAAGGKRKGNLVYSISYLEQSDRYDPNDLGFLQINNKRNITTSIGYNIYKPFWKLNRLWSSFTNSYERLYAPNEYIGTNYNLSLGITNKKFHSFNLFTDGTYTKNYDFFEARQNGYYFIRPRTNRVGGWISSNYQKAFALDAGGSFTSYQSPNWWDVNYYISPRFRLGNKAFLVYRFDETRNNNEIGYAIPFNGDGSNPTDELGPVMTERNVTTTTNTIDLSLTLTNKTGITLRVRHYWSRINANRFFELQENGQLNDLLDFPTLNNQNEEIYNTNYNAFSVDLVYRWIFSPASEMSIVWKNNIFSDNPNAQTAFLENMRQTLQTDQLNSFSVRLVYFLDYLDLRNFVNDKL